jgi:hypothetical protein
MSKWKAPEDAGPSVSIGGQTFNIVKGVVELPNEGEYASALIPFGYEPIPETVEDDGGKSARKSTKKEED